LLIKYCKLQIKIGGADLVLRFFLTGLYRAPVLAEVNNGFIPVQFACLTIRQPLIKAWLPGFGRITVLNIAPERPAW
jgi:hypothetical protein